MEDKMAEDQNARKSTADLERELVEVYVTDQRRTERDILEQEKRLRVGKQIGMGGYGVVYQMESLEEGHRQLACKVINLQERVRKHFTNELNLKRCRHLNLIELVDQFIIDRKGFLVMEFANGGTIGALVADGTPISENTSRKYFRQIFEGLMYMHRREIAHRDLKLDNLLLVIPPPPPPPPTEEEQEPRRKQKPQKIVKITDFGLSLLAYHPRRGHLRSASFAGTRPYMAPEIIRMRVHQAFRSDTCFDCSPFIADIWSLGVCLFEMLIGSLPFQTKSDETLLRLQEAKEYSFPKNRSDGEGSIHRVHPSHNARNLVSLMLEPDPSQRVDPFGIQTHPWLVNG